MSLALALLAALRAALNPHRPRAREPGAPTAARPAQPPIEATRFGRQLLDQVIVLNEEHLRRGLQSYLRYYHGSRTHLALEKDAPEPRAVEPPEQGRVVALPLVGGLHHRYVRRAA